MRTSRKTLGVALTALLLIVGLVAPAAANSGSVKVHNVEQNADASDNNPAPGCDFYAVAQNFPAGTYAWTVTGQGSTSGSFGSGSLEVAEGEANASTDTFSLETGHYKFEFTNTGKQKIFKVDCDETGSNSVDATPSHTLTRGQCDIADTLVLNASEGVEYQVTVDGGTMETVSQGTYTGTTGTVTVQVQAVATSGYELTASLEQQFDLGIGSCEPVQDLNVTGVCVDFDSDGNALWRLHNPNNYDVDYVLADASKTTHSSGTLAPGYTHVTAPAFNPAHIGWMVDDEREWNSNGVDSNKDCFYDVTPEKIWELSVPEGSTADIKVTPELVEYDGQDLVQPQLGVATPNRFGTGSVTAPETFVFDSQGDLTSDSPTSITLWRDEDYSVSEEDYSIAGDVAYECSAEIYEGITVENYCYEVDQLTILKEWTGDGEGDVTFNVMFRYYGSDNGVHAADGPATLSAGESITIPSGVSGVAIYENEPELRSGCTSVLTDVTDNREGQEGRLTSNDLYFGDERPDYSRPLYEGSLVVTFVNDVDCPGNRTTSTPEPEADISFTHEAECSTEDTYDLTLTFTNDGDADGTALVGDDEVEVPAGETVVETLEGIVTPMGVNVRIDGEVQPVHDDGVDYDPCTSEVEGVIETDPGETPDEPDDEVTPVQDTGRERAEAVSGQQLPETGSSPLLLVVLGLLSIGLGSVMLRRRTAEDVG